MLGKLINWLLQAP